MSKENTPTPDAVEQEEVLSRDADTAQDCLEQTEKQEVVNDALSDRINLRKRIGILRNSCCVNRPTLKISAKGSSGTRKTQLNTAIQTCF